MKVVIPITEDRNVIPLRKALQVSVTQPDEVELAGILMNAGGELLGAGESIRQSALMFDQPTIFQLADTIAICNAAIRAVCVYAVARGLSLSAVSEGK